MDFPTRLFLYAFAFSLSAVSACGPQGTERSSPPPAEQDEAKDGGDDQQRDGEDDTSDTTPVENDNSDGDAGDDDVTDDGDDSGDNDDTGDDNTTDDGGDDHDDTTTVEPGTPLPQELYGVWISENIPLSDTVSGDYCAQSRVEFHAPAAEGDPAIMKAFFIEYYNTNCTSPKWTTAIRVAVNNAGSVDAPAGATGLDYTLQELALKADSAGGKRSLEGAEGGRGFCGENDYDIDAYRRIMGKTCTHQDGREIVFPSADSKSYDVFKILDNKLFLGIQLNDEGNEINDERPTSFNDLTYTKQ